MYVTYQVSFVACCPVNDGTDEYSLTLESGHMIPVENLLDFLKVYRREAKYQEEITREIADQFNARKATTHGFHSGVETTCTVSS